MNTLLDAMKERGPAENRAETGYIENWGASLGQTIDEDLSVSEYLNSGAFRERNSELLDMIRAGDIPNSAIYHRDHKDFNGGINYDEAAKYANSMLDKKYQTDDEINKNIRESLQERRTLAESIHNDANVMGKIGQFAGALHGFAIDPINASTMFLGAGQLSRGVLNLAKREAIIAGTSEAAIQPFVHSWKQDIGADYSAGDAVANIVMATGMGGTIGALTAGIGKLLRKKPVTKEEKTAYEAAEYLQNELKEAPPEMGGAEFLGNIDNTVRQINDAKPEFITGYRGLKTGSSPLVAKDAKVTWITPDKEYANVYADAGGVVMKLDYEKPSKGMDFKLRDQKTEVTKENMLDRLQSQLMEDFDNKIIAKDKAMDINDTIQDAIDESDKEFKQSWHWYEDDDVLSITKEMGYDHYKGREGVNNDIETIGLFNPPKDATVAEGVSGKYKRFGDPLYDNKDFYDLAEQKTGFDASQGDEADLKFDTLAKENPDIPTILSHEKDLQGETVINYGRATDEVKKIEAQELELESIKGCLLGG